MQFDAVMTSGGAVLLGAVAVRAAVAMSTFVKERYQDVVRRRGQTDAFRQKLLGRPGQPSRAQLAAPAGWQEPRPFRVVRRVAETPDKTLCSFYLEPADQRPLPAYRPGQFLSFVIPLNENGATLRRCYSLSEAPAEMQGTYRVSVKRILPAGAPPGRVSNYFHDQLSEGQIVNVAPPAGAFTLDQTSNRPVVLIAGGVGITPLLSMLNWLAATNSQREIWLFHGVRNRGDHAFRDRIAHLCQTHININCVTFYSRPTHACRRGVDFDLEGHVRIEVMKKALRERNYTFYLCGPPAMMVRLQADLFGWGVPAEDIKIEKFGAPATADARTPITVAAPPSRKRSDTEFKINFLRSGKSATWSAGNGSLLELAELCGINARCSCRAGQCGTCKVRLKSGQIAYRSQPEAAVEPGTCLPCIAQPASNLSIDM
ncbi:MAG: 2Fe-2S iron-sulfur cluster-binding protein [Hyphomicrobiaceae bacterium]